MTNPKKQKVKHSDMHRRLLSEEEADRLPHGAGFSAPHTVNKDCNIPFEPLKINTENQRLIMNAALDAIICIDSHGHITFWNPQAAIIFGWPAEEALGKKLSSLIIPEQYRERHDKGMADYLKTGNGPALNKLLELSALNRKGTEFPIELTIMPITEKGGEFFCAFIRDITERRKSEQALQASHDEKNTILESIGDAFFTVDRNWIVTYWNKEAEKKLQTPKSLIIGKNLWEVFSTSVDSISYKKYHEALETSQVVNFEDHYPDLNKWYEISVYPSPSGLSVYFKDITENKKTESDLEKAYQEKITILESIDDGFFAVDNNSRVTYWNRKAELLLGESRESIIGKNLHEMFASPYSKEFYDNYQKAINENTTVHFEAFSQRSNKWFAVSAFASDKGLSVHFKDVTERKAFEEKIKESEIQYRTLIEQATDTICVADENTKFIDVNPSGCQLFGYSKEEFLELQVSDVIFEEDLKSNPIQFDLLKEGKTTSNERRIKRKDGSAIEVELNAKMLKDGNILVFGRDITERKKAERLVKESNERYNIISKATNDMVWDWNLVTGQVYRNKEGWKKIFGNEDVASEVGAIDDWDSRIHPDDIKKIKEVNDEILNSGKDFFEAECRMRKNDGKYVYIHDRGHILRNEKGKPVRLIGATQNITLRKEAELQVAKSEFRFRSLVQNSSDLICIFNENAYFMYSSPAIETMLGYNPEETLQKNAFSFIHPDDIEILKMHLKKSKEEKSLQIPTFRFKNAQGEWRWLESRISDMSDNPEIQGYVFNSRDVTERRLAEEEIKKLSIIAKETVNAVIVTDAQQKIVWVNEAFTRITEYKFEEVIGQHPAGLMFGEESNPATIAFIQGKVENVDPFECDMINYTKSGKKYWMRIQCQPQFDEAGNLKHFFAMGTDISKEKEAEDILKASEERYRYLFQNNPACISIWDIETYRILEVNDTAIELYGYSREDFLSKKIFDFSPEKYHDKLRLFAVEACKEPDFRSENTCKHYNNAGEVMYMQVNSHRIEFRGRKVILALANNITDKIILEKELENERFLKQQEITQAVVSAQEQERRELGGELHDNINQILAGSLLYIGLAKRELNIEHPYLAETDMLINMAIAEIRKLSHTLIPPALHESELVSALNNIIDVTKKTSGLNIKLYTYDFDETAIPDKLKLNIYRIVQEQFNNILKHAHAKKIMIRLIQDNEKTLLSIKDDGIGFDTSLKAAGVGLMNMKTRASFFNGELNIISSPGKGCELRVLFNYNINSFGLQQ